MQKKNDFSDRKKTSKNKFENEAKNDFFKAADCPTLFLLLFFIKSLTKNFFGPCCLPLFLYLKLHFVHFLDSVFWKGERNLLENDKGKRKCRLGTF